MRCQWQAFLELLPMWMRKETERLGKEDLQELRLRIHSQPELVTARGSAYLSENVRKEDIDHCINMASKYSPWAAESIGKGYITAPGGHRIGLCGSAVIAQGQLKGLRSITSLCMRIARDFPGIAQHIPLSGSVLIIGKPGSGKTTLLRDLIRRISDSGRGSVAVMDEREEIFPFSHQTPCFSIGKRTDVMTGCSKAQGIDMLLRTMGPESIALDEITAEEDCQALMQAGWCGVRLIATAHAGSMEELCSRKIYQPLVKSRLFDTFVVMHADKSYHWERMRI